MTKKLEEMFDLEPTDTAESMGEKLQKEQESKDDVEALDLIQQKVGLDKIDAALPQVDGLQDDNEIDKYAEESFQTYKDLMDLGMNIEPRLAGRIMEVASSMMQNAISAKNTKIDKKLKMIELQLKKAKLDQNTGDDEVVTGTGSVLADRNELIKQILANSKDDK
jgi:hypothetical protein|tara:strand:- start:372 stop:866 length:495 start_codon:yes stop_codon:yes gene_type:complete